jgi:hypothetical protein
MAVGLERAQAECLGQGQGSAVMGFGQCNLWGIASRRDNTEEVPRIRLVATLLVRTGECLCSLGERLCLL